MSLWRMIWLWMLAVSPEMEARRTFEENLQAHRAARAALEQWQQDAAILIALVKLVGRFCLIVAACTFAIEMTLGH